MSLGLKIQDNILGNSNAYCPMNCSPNELKAHSLLLHPWGGGRSALKSLGISLEDQP